MSLAEPASRLVTRSLFVRKYQYQNTLHPQEESQFLLSQVQSTKPRRGSLQSSVRRHHQPYKPTTSPQAKNQKNTLIA